MAQQQRRGEHEQRTPDRRPERGSERGVAQAGGHRAESNPVPLRPKKTRRANPAREDIQKPEER